MSKFMQFTVLRFALFMIPLLVLLLMKVELVWAVLIAALISMVVSLFLLRGPREQVARELEAGIARRQEAKRRKVASERMQDEDL